MTLLQSEAGCHEQQAHTDYRPADLRVARSGGPDGKDESRESREKLSDKDIPLSAIFALDAFQLKVWPGALAFKKRTNECVKPIVITVPALGLVVFRADLVHCGCPYKELNQRIHFFLDSALCPPEEGTYRIPPSRPYVNIKMS
jgi:hypothetical protein